MDVATLYRSNFCPRVHEIMEGKFNISLGLKGLQIKALLDKKIDPVYFQINNATGQPYAGIMYEIEREIAKRGQFEWKYTVATLPKQKRGTLSYFKYILERTDIIAVYNSDSLQRRMVGTGFTQSVVDASLMLITVEESHRKNSYWNFLLPFSGYLWFAILGSVLFQGFLSAFLEKLEMGENPLSNLYKLSTHSLTLSYHTWGSYIGAGTITHVKTSTKILNVGYMVVVFVLVSTYTANMASFLLVQATTKIGVSSIEQAVQERASVCVIAGSNAQSQLATFYPGVRIVTFPDVSSAADTHIMYRRLREGACDAAVSAKIDWQTNVVLKKSNPLCNLVATDTFRSFSGSIAYKTDYSGNCTSLLESVVSAIIVDMKSDGSLEDIIDNYLDTFWKDQTCSRVTKASTRSQLSSSDVAGVYMLYIMFVALAAIVAIRKYFASTHKTQLPTNREKDSFPAGGICVSQDHDGMVECSQLVDVDQPLRREDLASLITTADRLSRSLDRALKYQPHPVYTTGTAVDDDVQHGGPCHNHGASLYNEAFVEVADYLRDTAKRQQSLRRPQLMQVSDSGSGSEPSDSQATTRFSTAESLDAWLSLSPQRSI